MAELSKTARQQIGALAADYRAKQRLEAVRNLRQAMVAAGKAADDPATRYRDYPASYHSLARPGIRWILVHIYWVAYRVRGADALILNVFWAQADIPARHTSRSDGS